MDAGIATGRSPARRLQRRHAPERTLRPMVHRPDATLARHRASRDRSRSRPPARSSAGPQRSNSRPAIAGGRGGVLGIGSSMVASRQGTLRRCGSSSPSRCRSLVVARLLARPGRRTGRSFAHRRTARERATRGSTRSAGSRSSCSRTCRPRPRRPWRSSTPAARSRTAQDGAVFQNREGLLPRRRPGYYREYTVETPGSDDRGARRIVAGADGERYWTDDHYDFVPDGSPRDAPTCTRCSRPRGRRPRRDRRPARRRPGWRRRPTSTAPVSSSWPARRPRPTLIAALVAPGCGLPGLDGSQLGRARGAPRASRARPCRPRSSSRGTSRRRLPSADGAPPSGRSSRRRGAGRGRRSAPWSSWPARIARAGGGRRCRRVPMPPSARWARSTTSRSSSPRSRTPWASGGTRSACRSRRSWTSSTTGSASPS